MKKLELKYCGVRQVEIQGVRKSRRKVMITVDSGAESVTSEQNFPEIPTRPSSRSRGGVEYVNAKGSTMPNRGKSWCP